VTLTTLLAALAVLLALPLGAAAAPARDQLLAWKGEEQIFGYSHMSKIFSTKLIKRGPDIQNLPSGTPLMVRYELGSESGSIEDFMARNHVAALLVASHGKLVIERYGLGQTAATRWTSFSVAKSLTSTLIGVAIKEGHIGSINDPISRYIGELKNTAYEPVTIAQLMEMRTGVEWNEDYSDRNSDAWWLAREFASDRGRLVSYMAKKKRIAPPGSVFNYNTGETNLAGILVSRAVGEPISQYLSERIWSRIGTESDAYWVATGGLEVGGCCISMRPRDYLRFALFFLHEGSIEGKPILPPNWREQATTAYTQHAFGSVGYGWFWWPRADASYEAIGIFGQSVQTDPKAELVVVTLSAWPDADWQEGYARQEAFFTAVRAAVPASSPEPP